MGGLRRGMNCKGTFNRVKAHCWEEVCDANIRGFYIQLNNFFSSLDVDHPDNEENVVEGEVYQDALD